MGVFAVPFCSTYNHRSHTVHSTQMIPRSYRIAAIFVLSSVSFRDGEHGIGGIRGQTLSTCKTTVSKIDGIAHFSASAVRLGLL